ncbi:MAG TPA: DNA polymerase III subunit alpha [Firmicutes bacterium]|nr:DNA polymerase III subunit alpha [Bacillota bacterium]
MDTTQFVHIHVHTEFSLLDGAARISSLVDKAAQWGMPALAITDHGYMYGCIEFYKCCKSRGIKPIIGCEMYVARKSMLDKTAGLRDEPHHLVLLAENEEGYRNLLKLVTEASLNGFYYKPRVDLELLRQYPKGLIALSACQAGEIPELLLSGEFEKARHKAIEYESIFGKGNFYLELQENGMPGQKELNRLLMQLSESTGIPLVATNDCHYLEKQDWYAHDVLLCVQTGKTYDDPRRLRFQSKELYFKSPSQMISDFAYCPEAIENTLRIADRCSLELEFGKLHLPAFAVPEGRDERTHLRELCQKRLASRYPNPSAEVMARLEHELGVIERMGYSGYFLIVSDFVDYAKRHGIPVGPGRGSAAGSIVAYILGITEVDPLSHGLLFERFLNPERVSMPDIDIDFCYERRPEVIQYVTQKYGADCVAQIITFGTMAARAAIRDVGRVLGFPYMEVDRIAKLVPIGPGVTLQTALEQSPELGAAYRSNEKVATLIDLAAKLEGLPRHTSVHAAGVVITGEPLVNTVPLQRAQEGMVTTQYPMEALEELGLLKMDFLGLRTLTVIDECVKMVNRRERLDLSKLSLDDADTYKLLSCGETAGVFQLESGWVKDFLKSLKPARFEDIVAAVALCRPGPMEQIPEFINAKHAGAHYLHPVLEPILSETYGVIVYQEQIMRIAATVAGFTMGQADILRRAVGKKKRELLDEMQSAFVAGCLRNGYPRELADQLYDLILKFANYGFNKAHAVAYALIAYQTAYLKAHYPAEFMAALMTSVAGAPEKVAMYVEESRRMGVAVLPPDINESLEGFTPTPDGIRFGLGAIKNVGTAAVKNIIAARASRPFRSLADFCSRVDSRVINKRVLESLIKAGSMDSFGPTRSQLLAMIDEAMELSPKAKQQTDGQLSLFEGTELHTPEVKVPQVRELSKAKLLAFEKEVLGLYVSGHPLEQYRHELHSPWLTPLIRLRELPDGKVIQGAGAVVSVRKTTTRRGEPMAFVTVEDFTGSAELVVFPSAFSKCSGWLKSQNLVTFSGRVSRREEQTTIIIIEDMRNLAGERSRTGSVDRSLRSTQ